MGLSRPPVNDASALGRTRHRLLHWIEDRYLAADLRWLGIFRLLFGGLLCVDLLRRWGVARDFYSNDGILPNHFSPVLGLSAETSFRSSMPSRRQGR